MELPNKNRSTFSDSYLKDQALKNKNFENTDESMEVLKENVSIGYLNNSVKHKKSTSTNKSCSIEEYSMHSGSNDNKTLDLKNTLINQNQLRTYLKTHKTFPEKSRLFIWKNILELPENKEAFNNLIKRGIAPEYQNMYKNYQLNSENLFRKLQRIISAFSFYSPAFLNVPFFQDMIFPFIKLFGHHELLCFEIILSFFLNWGQHFFEYAPNPPVDFFKSVNEIIMAEDKEFWEFLQERRISSIFLLWPSLQVLFTNVLQKDEWLALMDFLILNRQKPEFFVYFSAVLLLSYKTKIMKNDDDIFTIDSYEQNLTIDKILTQIEKLEAKLPFNFLSLNFKQNLPLIKDQYPIYNFYPAHDLDDHRKMREKIIEEEEKYVEEKKKLTFAKIQNISNGLINAQNAMKTDMINFAKKVDEEKELLKIDEELLLKRKIDFDEKRNFENIIKMEKMENDFKKTVKEQIECRELEKNQIEKELDFKKKIDDLRISSKLKDEALNSQHFELLMRMKDLIKQREIQEEERDSMQKRKFYETKQFYENCLKDEKLNREKTLFLLKRDLDMKKQMVEENMFDELKNKKAENEEFLLKNVKNNLEQTLSNNMREMHQEIDKERIMTNDFADLKRKVEESPIKGYKTTQGLIKRNAGKTREMEKDEEMERFKNNMRAQMNLAKTSAN